MIDLNTNIPFSCLIFALLLHDNVLFALVVILSVWESLCHTRLKKCGYLWIIYMDKQRIGVVTEIQLNKDTILFQNTCR